MGHPPRFRVGADGGEVLADNVSIIKSKPRSRPARPATQEQRLHQVLGVLREHATVVVSGTKMSQELGANRSTVWRLVQQLRRYGVEIRGHPTTGYALKQMPDLGLAEILDPLIAGTIFHGKIQHSFQVDSTNAQAMQAAAAGAPEGTVFLAEHQSAGRGRGGHAWLSPKAAGIYLSLVLRPRLGPAEVLKLSLAAGLAAQEAVEQCTGLRADLRWPNDLLLRGKKFCGILAEMNAEPTAVRHVALGTGINVNQAGFAGELGESATSLLLETRRSQPLERVPLIAALLKSLDSEYRALVRGEPVISRFEARSTYARGRRVRVEEQGGYQGITAGLDERGFLRVETKDGMRMVISGGVREVE